MGFLGLTETATGIGQELPGLPSFVQLNAEELAYTNITYPEDGNLFMRSGGIWKNIHLETSGAITASFDGSTLLLSVPPGLVNHNDLLGLQGGLAGSTSEYYHLTAGELAEVNSFFNNLAYAQSGDLMLYNGTHWRNTPLLTSGSITATYDGSSLLLTVQAGVTIASGSFPLGQYDGQLCYREDLEIMFLWSNLAQAWIDTSTGGGGGGAIAVHNQMQGLQGGYQDSEVSEYYHLDQATYTALISGLNYVSLAPSTTLMNTVQPTLASVVPLTIKGKSAQAANLQEWQDSAGAPLVTVTAIGGMTAAKDITVNGIRMGVGPGTYGNNVVFGSGALASNGSSQQNTAIGTNALNQQNSANNGNTAVGYGSAAAMTTGDWNVAVGLLAMGSATGTSFAVGVGGQALKAGGSYSVAVGSNAAGQNSGTHNVAIGYSALNGPNGYGNNVAVGSYALQQANFGLGSVGIGYEAGKYIADGATQNSASDYSVFLGLGTKANSTTQTNQIVIGYNAIGAGSNSVTLGNTSITQTILRGTVTATAPADATIGVIVKGFSATQSANLQEWRDSAGAVLASISAAGVLTTPRMVLTPVTAAGATPVDTDVSAWANNSFGFVVGTGGRVFSAWKNAADVYYVEMTAI